LKFSRLFAQKNKSKIYISSKYAEKPSTKCFTFKVYPNHGGMPSARSDFQNANKNNNPQILKMSAILAFSLAVSLVQYELKGANRSGCMNNSRGIASAVAESHEG
jgi:hypothetical protein